MNAFDVGLWRSPDGDSYGARDPDWVPQCSHVFSEAHALVACMNTSGGGATQMRKAELDPLLGEALARWSGAPPLGTPVAALERWYAELQAGFDGMTEPAWAADFQATGVAVLLRDDGAAVGNVGLERAYRFRDGRLEQLTVDDSVARDGPLSLATAAGLRKRRPDLQNFNRWTVGPLPAVSGDILLLISGLGGTGLATPHLEVLLRRQFEVTSPLGAQDLATKLGASLLQIGASAPQQTRLLWRMHTQIALAIVGVD